MEFTKQVFLILPFCKELYLLVGVSSFLGFGTTLVSPTFLSIIAQVTWPIQRAESIGTFLLWIDFGDAFGVEISGITTDLFGVEYVIYLGYSASYFL